MNQYTRYLTVLLAAFQSYGIAIGLEGAGNVISDPGRFFRISMLITLTGGTMFLMWLGEQITSRGIGNGISLIILAGIVARIALRNCRDPRAGSPGRFVDRADPGGAGDVGRGHRFHRVHGAGSAPAAVLYPKRQVGNRMFEGQSSHLPLKLNTSGVIPPIFASSLLLLPTTVANFNAGQGPDWFVTLTTQLGHGRPLFLIFYVGLIVFFAFFYTAIVFNPTETADNLKKHGASFPASGRGSGRRNTSTMYSPASR